jgi:hypothetical protein
MEYKLCCTFKKTKGSYELTFKKFKKINRGFGKALLDDKW